MTTWRVVVQYRALFGQKMLKARLGNLPVAAPPGASDVTIYSLAYYPPHTAGIMALDVTDYLDLITTIHHHLKLAWLILSVPLRQVCSHPV
jgi:hypothetical protein